MLDTQETLSKLQQAVHNNEFDNFKATYTEWLKQFPAFNAAHSEGPAPVIARSAVFGHKLFHLNQTTDEQAHRILENGEAAKQVFGKLDLTERLRFLEILEKKIAAHSDDIALTITADTGKPLSLARAEVTAKGKDWFDYAKENAEQQIGFKKVDGKITNFSSPLGVAQVIGAFNYPYALAIGGIVGALAGGNSVVVASPLKAPNWVFPFTAAAQEAIKDFTEEARTQNKPWAEDFAQAGPALVQCSTGVNNYLTKNADVVHFVGSTNVGHIISESRGAMKRTILEMGGSNVVTVMKSALDEKPAAAIAEDIYGGFGPASGQRCTAPRILCIQEGAEDVVKELGKRCIKGKDDVGNPFDDGVKMGPMVDADSHQKMRSAITLAKELGATVHGEMTVNNNIIPQANGSESYWVNPIVIDWGSAQNTPENVKRIHDCLKDEIFGPLLHVVHPVKTLDEAIAVTNTLDDVNKLAGAIYTSNAQDVHRMMQETDITSLTHNNVPKDYSAKGSHGHPGLNTIGAGSHFNLYCSNRTISSPTVSAART